MSLPFAIAGKSDKKRPIYVTNPMTVHDVKPGMLLTYRHYDWYDNPKNITTESLWLVLEQLEFRSREATKFKIVCLQSGLPNAWDLGMTVDYLFDHKTIHRFTPCDQS